MSPWLEKSPSERLLRFFFDTGVVHMLIILKQASLHLISILDGTWCHLGLAAYARYLSKFRLVLLSERNSDALGSVQLELILLAIEVLLKFDILVFQIVIVVLRKCGTFLLGAGQVRLEVSYGRESTVSAVDAFQIWVLEVVDDREVESGVQTDVFILIVATALGSVGILAVFVLYCKSWLLWSQVLESALVHSHRTTRLSSSGAQ